METGRDTFSSVNTDIRGVTGLNRGSDVMQEIEHGIIKYMNRGEFQSEKHHAISAGAPINKFDIKLSNINIDQALSNAYGSRTESLNQT